jgi:hypothetical protein
MFLLLTGQKDVRTFVELCRYIVASNASNLIDFVNPERCHYSTNWTTANLIDCDQIAANWENCDGSSTDWNAVKLSGLIRTLPTVQTVIRILPMRPDGL